MHERKKSVRMHMLWTRNWTHIPPQSDRGVCHRYHSEIHHRRKCWVTNKDVYPIPMSRFPNLIISLLVLQITPTSSLWSQLWVPQPLWLQSSNTSSWAVQPTLSNQIGPSINWEERARERERESERVREREREREINWYTYMYTFQGSFQENLHQIWSNFTCSSTK